MASKSLSVELNDKFQASYARIVDAYTAAIDYINVLEQKELDPNVAEEIHTVNLYLVKQHFINGMLNVLDDIGLPLEISDEAKQHFNSCDVPRVLVGIIHES